MRTFTSSPATSLLSATWSAGQMLEMLRLKLSFLSEQGFAIDLFETYEEQHLLLISGGEACDGELVVSETPVGLDLAQIRSDELIAIGDHLTSDQIVSLVTAHLHAAPGSDSASH